MNNIQPCLSPAPSSFSPSSDQARPTPDPSVSPPSLPLGPAAAPPRRLLSGRSHRRAQRPAPAARPLRNPPQTRLVGRQPRLRQDRAGGRAGRRVRPPAGAGELVGTDGSDGPAGRGFADRCARRRRRRRRGPPRVCMVRRPAAGRAAAGRLGAAGRGAFLDPPNFSFFLILHFFV